MKVLRLLFLPTLLFGQLWSDAQVNADFLADTTEGCAPVTIQFQDQSSGGKLRYLWSFGNGNVSTKKNPSAIYYLPGKYTVSLEITDTNGNKSIKKQVDYISVFKNPIANFTATPLFGCAPLLVSYTNTSTLGDAPFSTFLWDFGDGNTLSSSSGTPTHSYVIDGKFNVSLLVRDQNNCESKFDRKNYIEVERIPEPNLMADSRFSCKAPLTINFTNLSKKTSPTDTILWDFGDGSTSYNSNPQHTYIKEGTYTVTITIITTSGCSISRVLTNYISIKPIVVDFIADKRNVCAPATINFTNKTVPSGLVSKWEFGDGTSSNGYNTTHEYKNTGVYDITLSVKASSTCKAKITIPNFISVIDYPTAKFNYGDTTSCTIPFSILTTDKSINFTKRSWYLDTSYLGNTANSYASINMFGQYTFSLIAENQYGCKDTSVIDLIIDSLKINLESDIYRGCKPLEVTLFDSTKHDYTITSRLWKFGDGDSSTSLTKYVKHTYADTGVFRATLHVITSDGCESTDTITIEVGQKTNPTFTINKDSFCNREELVLTSTFDLIKPTVDSFLWFIFSDTLDLNETFVVDSSNIEVAPPPFLEFRQTQKRKKGWYTAGLVTEHNGCFDTIIMDSAFYIKDPYAAISGDLDPCTSDIVELTNFSCGADSIIWEVESEFKLPYSDTAERLLIYRDSNGTTEITLWAYNFESGCVDKAIYNISFNKKFNPEIITTGDLCSPANISFTGKSNEDSFLYIYDWTIDGKNITDQQNVFHQFTKSGSYTIELKVTQWPTDCIKKISKIIEVTGPTVKGDVSYSSSCPPLAVVLDCSVHPNSFDTLYWEVEGRKIFITDSGTINDTLFMPGRDTANHTIIKLIGIDSNGCIGELHFPVKVDGPASAYLKIRRFGSCDAQQYIFSAEVPGFDKDNFTYSWDLGNGDTSTKQEVGVYYTSEGIYEVKLTITEANGCKYTYTEIIDITKERLQVDFNADSIASDCPPLFVQFRNRSKVNLRELKSFFWEFGDGTTSIEENPSKLYLKAGKFTVKLFVEDEWGCKDSIIYPDFIIVNGPEGEYTFDKKRGCVPLTVNFTSTTKRTTFYEWDMGDGNVINNTPNLTHTYTIPGRYIPLLILSDTFGCSYTLPPVDTIYVDPYPEPEFTYKGTCVNYPISFSGINKSKNGTDTYLWEMMTSSGIDTITDKNCTYTFYNISNPKVRLTITSQNGCSNTILETLNLKILESDFTTATSKNCIGSIIEIKNTTKSDTTISFRKWLIDGQEYSENNPKFLATKLGPVNITLIQENSIGCKDTIHNFTVVIGDINPPLDIEMLRVTVNDNETIQIDYKKSIIPDFTSYNIYKENAIGYSRIATITDLNTTSFLSTNNNTLSTSYCFKVEVLNSCGLSSDTLTHYKHCTIETKAKGDTNRNLVNWSAYQGWDSVSTYNIYRKELGTMSILQKVGSVHGDSLRYIDSMLYCNIEYSYKIEAEENEGNVQISFSDTSNAIPNWDYSPPPNKLVRATVEDDLEILIEWDSVKNSVIPIISYVLEKSKDGVNYYKLEETENQTFSYIDQEVLVDDFSYLYRTYAIDECNDTTQFLNYGKTILLAVDTSNDQRPKANWSHYEGWTEDIAYYAIEIKNEDNSFTEIATFPYKDTSFIDILTDLNQRPHYCYRIVAYKVLVSGEPQIVSVSNEDCSPVRSKIFYPTAFTPNRDNLNDFYVTPSEYIKDYEIRIYNRWGEKVFVSFDLTQNWDGTYKGEDAQMDVYAVIVITTGVDLVRRVHHGTITLVR